MATRLLSQCGISRKIDSMNKSLSTIAFYVALVLALAIGQGPLGAVMAMPAMNGTGQMPMDMARMDMAGSSQASNDCYAASGNGKAVNHAMGCAYCVVAAQTAILPVLIFLPVQYAVAQSYELTDMTAVSQTAPPDLPPPKV